MSSTTVATDNEDRSKRRQITEGARAIFLDRGFDGASMGEIARAAGVSKGTLYVYFTDKSQLFEAIVEEVTFEQRQASFNVDPARDVPTTLMDFGQEYIRWICRPAGGSAIRTVMAIAERMPDVGQRFYEKVLAETIRSLAGYLAAHVNSKELVIEDCELAAAQFLLTCQATLFLPFIFQAKPTPAADEIARVVASATQMFLAAYRAKTA